MKIKLCCYGLLLALFVSCTQKNGHTDRGKETVTTADSTLKWIDYRFGELPPVGYYMAMDSIIRKWGIRYERMEGGCEVRPAEQRRYEKDNYKYFRILENTYGKNWRERFNAEVSALDREFQKDKQTHKKQ